MTLEERNSGSSEAGAAARRGTRRAPSTCARGAAGIDRSMMNRSSSEVAVSASAMERVSGVSRRFSSSRMVAAKVISSGVMVPSPEISIW